MVRQEWRDVAFVHWPVPNNELASIVPEPLTVDTMDGVAWLTLTPFSTTCRLVGAVPVPGPRSFPETNLRTYVKAPDGTDGLFFLSLDVTNRANAVLGRLLRLPYRLSDMVIHRSPDDPAVLRYAGNRRRPDESAAYELTVRVAPAPVARPTALDTFLTGRWSAYTLVAGLLLRCDVEHEPWPLHCAQVVEVRQTLARSIVRDPAGEVMAHYSVGVSARLSRPHPCRAGGTGEVLTRAAARDQTADHLHP